MTMSESMLFVIDEEGKLATCGPDQCHFGQRSNPY
jgi:hypothetical protein